MGKTLKTFCHSPPSTHTCTHSPFPPEKTIKCKRTRIFINFDLPFYYMTTVALWLRHKAAMLGSWVQIPVYPSAWFIFLDTKGFIQHMIGKLKAKSEIMTKKSWGSNFWKQKYLIIFYYSLLFKRITMKCRLAECSVAGYQLIYGSIGAYIWKIEISFPN